MNIVHFLEERNVEHERILHGATYDAQRMAESVHTPGSEVAKTVLLRANGGYVYIVALAPAHKSIDLEKASQVFGGSKLTLASEAEIKQRCPDCETGALPPFGSQYGMKTVADASLAGQEEIVFEGNTHQEAIRMKFEDFRRLEEPLVADIAL